MGEKRKQERSQTAVENDRQTLHGAGLTGFGGGCACPSEPQSTTEHHPPESGVCPAVTPSVKLFFFKSWVRLFFRMVDCTLRHVGLKFPHQGSNPRPLHRKAES